MEEKAFAVTSEAGIHARPATILVNEASRYSSEIKIEYKGNHVNLKSIMNVMSVGIHQDAKIKVIANGPDEKDAISGITEIFKNEGLGDLLS